MTVRTHRELHNEEPPVGYEADMGCMPPRHHSPGRWTVRRNFGSWTLLFHSFVGAEYVVQEFPATEAGERAARTMGLNLVDIAWGRR